MNLTAGMVTVAGGVATLSSAGATTLTATDDPMVCGPWAITRWLRVLDVVMTQPQPPHPGPADRRRRPGHRTCVGRTANCPR